MLRAVVLKQYRRVTDGQTDGQTDGIAVASTALGMRRAVKIQTDPALQVVSIYYGGHAYKVRIINTTPKTTNNRGFN